MATLQVLEKFWMMMMQSLRGEKNPNKPAAFKSSLDHQIPLISAHYSSSLCRIFQVKIVCIYVSIC